MNVFFSTLLEPKAWQGGRRDFNRQVNAGRPSRFRRLWLFQRRRAAGERDVSWTAGGGPKAAPPSPALAASTQRTSKT